MRGAIAREQGPPEVVTVEELAPPELRPGAVRVAVDAAAVNFPDLLILAGKYQAAVAPPYTPGCEFSGHVVEVADGVTRVKPGEQVFGLATHGAFAEEIVIDDFRVTPVPRPFDPNVLAAFSVTYFTAYHALHTFGRVQPGEHVTVLGASGGVGMAAVDVAVALGARPVAVGGNPAKLEACLDKGAIAAIDYTTEDLKARLNEVTGGGSDVVIDPVGGEYTEPALRAMRWGGRYIVLGFAAGDIPRIPVNLLLLKGIWAMGFENRTIHEHIPELTAQHRLEVLDLLLEGRIAPHIGSVRPLDDVVGALREVADRRVVGKAVVQVRA